MTRRAGVTPQPPTQPCSSVPIETGHIPDLERGGTTFQTSPGRRQWGCQGSDLGGGALSITKARQRRSALGKGLRRRLRRGAAVLFLASRPRQQRCQGPPGPTASRWIPPGPAGSRRVPSGASRCPWVPIWSQLPLPPSPQRSLPAATPESGAFGDVTVTRVGGSESPPHVGWRGHRCSPQLPREQPVFRAQAGAGPPVGSCP